MFRGMIENEKRISRKAQTQSRYWKGASFKDAAYDFDALCELGFERDFVRNRQDEISKLICSKDNRYK